MSEPIRPPSQLHEAARSRFPAATLRDLTTFAPPSPAQLVELLDEGSGILVAINAEKISGRDPVIAAMTSEHVGYPDGIGAVLALRRRGIKAQRMAGADLWLAILDRYAANRSFFLIGGTDAVIQVVEAKLRDRYPAMRLWARDGYVSAAELDHLEQQIGHRKPDFVFVAMGSPKQEIVMRRFYASCPAVYLGLGGSFDVYAGVKSRAPRWLQRMGLEWAYRVVREPTRLRRLPTYMRFLATLISGRY